MGLDGRKSAYDADFFTWTQDQAKALRALDPARVGNEVDLAHVAEEIEDLGKREVREVESQLIRLFEHLMKLAYMPNSEARNHWLGEADGFQAQAAIAFKPSMGQAVDLERAWKFGRRNALGFLKDRGIAADPSKTCPFDLETVISDEFEPETALKVLAQ
ncbi:MAG: DUF29 domain-containing protein [Tagaea sp.]|nr:DUF29 domain-containing protein [Tagaea sp.]